MMGIANKNVNADDFFNSVAYEDIGDGIRPALLLSTPETMLQKILDCICENYSGYFVSATNIPVTLQQLQKDTENIDYGIPKNSGTDTNGQKEMLNFLRDMVKVKQEQDFYKKLSMLMLEYIKKWHDGQHRKAALNLAILHCVKVPIAKKGNPKHIDSECAVPHMSGFENLTEEQISHLADVLLRQMSGQLMKDELSFMEEMYMLPGKLYQKVYLTQKQVNASHSIQLKECFKTRQYYDNEIEVSEHYIMYREFRAQNFAETLLSLVQNEYMELFSVNENKLKQSKLLLPEEGASIESVQRYHNSANADLKFNFELIQELLQQYSGGTQFEPKLYFGKSKQVGIGGDGKKWMKELLLEFAKENFQANSHRTATYEKISTYFIKKIQEVLGSKRSNILDEALRHHTPFPFIKINTNRGPIHIKTLEQLQQSLIEYINRHYMQLSNKTPPAKTFLFAHRQWNETEIPNIEDVRKNEIYFRSHKGFSKTTGEIGMGKMKDLLQLLCDTAIKTPIDFMETLLKNQDNWSGENAKKIISEFICKNVVLILNNNNEYIVLYDTIKQNFMKNNQELPWDYETIKSFDEYMQDAANISLRHSSENLNPDEPNIQQWAYALDNSVWVTQEELNALQSCQTCKGIDLGLKKN